MSARTPDGGAERPLVVGIDLGTTNSLVAIMQADAPVVIPNALGEHLTPSAVSVGDDGTILVGAAALARQATHPERTATTFKRDMGTERVYSLGNRRLTPQDLSAMVLRSLRQDVENALGRSIDEAVITVPAYFDEAQRRATQDAAAIAGLKVERIINEPTAAAMAYGLHHRSREFRAVVLDLGGGTFDVTVLEVMEGVIEIQSSSGDTRLGGEDFVDALAELVATRDSRAETRADPRAWAAVRAACERAKRRLSTQAEAQVLLTEVGIGRGRTLSVQQAISRQDAERTWEPLLARMRAPILRALSDAQLRPEQVDEVLVVGGATRMPCVIRMATEMFGRLPLRSLPPDEAVAFGAAVQAALKSRNAAVDDLVVTDVAPFSMGIATVDVMGTHTASGLFTPVLERGTVIPASRVKSFHTVQAMQKEIKIEIYQGEHALCRENRKLGEFIMGSLPLKPAGEAAIDVRFTYDLNGLLEVEALVPETGQKRAVVLEQTPGRLTPAQIADARLGMERLKFHPRDALPNTTAMARAEALFTELTGAPRELLARHMSNLRLALQGQDPAAIVASREQLIVFMAAVVGND